MEYLILMTISFLAGLLIGGNWISDLYEDIIRDLKEYHRKEMDIINGTSSK